MRILTLAALVVGLACALVVGAASATAQEADDTLDELLSPGVPLLNSPLAPAPPGQPGPEGQPPPDTLVDLPIPDPTDWIPNPLDWLPGGLNPVNWAKDIVNAVFTLIGQAMLEEIAYDPESGQLLTASLMDYCLPRAEDLPPLDVTCVEVPTASNRLGVKGSGQAGCIGAPQTVMHAVLDALAPLGIETLDMPVTPNKVWAAIHRRA